MCNSNKTLVTEENVLKSGEATGAPSTHGNYQGWSLCLLQPIRRLRCDPSEARGMWPVTSEGCFWTGWGHCWWCSASRAMVRTETVTSGTMRAQPCQNTRPFNTSITRSPRPRKERERIFNTGTWCRSQHQEAHSNAVRKAVLYDERQEMIYVFRSWQKDEVQVGVKRRTEWEEIYLSGRRHNLVMQVNFKETKTNVSHKLWSLSPLALE